MSPPAELSVPSIGGTCDDRFAEVRAEFERNFTDRDEVGAALHVLVDGRPVVDLWGGVTAPGGAPWTEDTLVVVFSCTKGATALCAHVLADRGQLDLDAPVAEYWPEFAAAGKDGATVAMMLNHSVGVPAIRDRLPDGACTDWDLMCDRLAAEPPFWEPGTRNGYHMLTFGWTVGELVRRVSGRSLGTFFADEIAGPLDAAFFIGLPASEFGRVAPVIQPTPNPDRVSEFTRTLLADPTSIPRLAWMNTGGFEANDPAVNRAEIGGGGGLATARGLARIYGPLAAGGGDLVSADAVTRMSQVSVATGRDETLLLPTRFGLGFMLSMDNRRRAGDTDSVILSAAGFGHVGAGGSIGFADPSCGLAVGYVMNRMGPGILLNERGQSLIDAVYRALGHRTDDPGVWVR
ncbi:MAG: serine hydrolase domain-containing protein [Actinomycetota bacterium]